MFWIVFVSMKISIPKRNLLPLVFRRKSLKVAQNRGQTKWRDIERTKNFHSEVFKAILAGGGRLPWRF